MPTIKIQQWNSTLDNRGGSILETALGNGVPYPHSCRSGECGSCKTRLLSGEVDHDPYDPAVLSDEERAGGMVLACRARPLSDLEVAWMADVEQLPGQPLRQFNARVTELEKVTHDVVRLRLEPRGDALAFRAGQYAQLGFSGQPPRPYSMANRPDETGLEFHIRHVPGGRASGYAAQELREGHVVSVEGPFGSACLSEDHTDTILATAGGTGYAPIRSIVRTALRRDPDRHIHIYFGVRDEQDVYGENELKRFAANHPNVRAHVVLSEPTSATSRRVGFVHQAIESDEPDLSRARIYAAGPPPMVKGVTTTVLRCGACADAVHADPFTPSQDQDSQSLRVAVHINPRAYVTNVLQHTLDALASIRAESWRRTRRTIGR